MYKIIETITYPQYTIEIRQDKNGERIAVVVNKFAETMSRVEPHYIEK